MKKELAKRRSLNDTLADLIKSGKLTQKELDEAKEEALREPEWQLPAQPKSTSSAH